MPEPIVSSYIARAKEAILQDGSPEEKVERAIDILAHGSQHVIDELSHTIVMFDSNDVACVYTAICFLKKRFEEELADEDKAIANILLDLGGGTEVTADD